MIFLIVNSKIKKKLFLLSLIFKKKKSNNNYDNTHYLDEF